MTRSLMRPAFLSLALLGALALASRAQDKGGARDVDGGNAPAQPRAADKDRVGKDAAAAASGPRDFSGKYLADGISNAGRRYKAMVEITRDGDVYQVVWVLGPREAYSGVGVTEGDALCVGWAIGEVPGVVIYKPDAQDQASKKLVGRWTAPGSQGKTFTETLTFIP